MDTYKLVLNADSKHNFWLKINILCAAVTHSILFKKSFHLITNEFNVPCSCGCVDMLQFSGALSVAQNLYTCTPACTSVCACAGLRKRDIQSIPVIEHELRLYMAML